MQTFATRSTKHKNSILVEELSRRAEGVNTLNNFPTGENGGFRERSKEN